MSIEIVIMTLSKILPIWRCLDPLGAHFFSFEHEKLLHERNESLFKTSSKQQENQFSEWNLTFWQIKRIRRDEIHQKIWFHLILFNIEKLLLKVVEIKALFIRKMFYKYCFFNWLKWIHREKHLLTIDSIFPWNMIFLSQENWIRSWN